MLKWKPRLKKSTIRKSIECFMADVSATQAARLSKVNRNTANLWHGHFRKNILLYQEEVLGQMSGEVELDESYFGGPRKKKHAGDRRKRGRGAENKIPVFGIKKRTDGNVYTQIIKNASKRELLPIIKKLVTKNNTTIYTDKWKSYDGLVLDGYKHKTYQSFKDVFEPERNTCEWYRKFLEFCQTKTSKVQWCLTEFVSSAPQRM